MYNPPSKCKYVVYSKNLLARHKSNIFGIFIKNVGVGRDGGEAFPGFGGILPGSGEVLPIL